MLYILAALLLVLIGLVIVLLARQPDSSQPQLPAKLDPEDTARIVTELRLNLTQVQGEIQKVGVEQLVAHNKACPRELSQRPRRLHNLAVRHGGLVRARQRQPPDPR